MYDHNTKQVFDGIHHLNLCNDGSSVNGVSYNFAIAYGWEVNEGCVGNVQVVNQGKFLLETDHELPEDLEAMRYSKQLVRVASFRLMQAHSALSQQLTGRKLSDYEASNLGLNLAAVQPGQARHVIQRGTTQHAWICCSDTGTPLYRALPEDDDLPAIFPQITYGEDQCLVNSAGSYFQDSKDMMVLQWTHYDITQKNPRC